jgi:AcrR family transcriptional regulator
MNHVVTSTDDLRTSHVNSTRDRIARATAEVMLREGPTALSFPAVAEEAGVSLRTVYRHFPNKDALVLAAVHVGAEHTHTLWPHRSVSVSDLRTFLPMLWEELDSQRDLIAVQQSSPAGKAVRRERLQIRRDDVVAALAAEHADIPEEDRARLANIATVLLGSSVLFDLVDLLDVDVAEAAALSAYVIEAAAERASRDGGIR